MVAALTLSAAVLALASAATATAASAAVAEPTSLFFSLGFSSRSVLPRAPASALIYGGGAAGPSCTGVQLVLHSSSRAVVSIVKADLIGHSGSWAAHLPPRSAGFGYSLNATCSFDGAPVARQPDSIELTDVAFGDTLLCTGQSNMSVWHILACSPRISACPGCVIPSIFNLLCLVLTAPAPSQVVAHVVHI